MANVRMLSLHLSLRSFTFTVCVGGCPAGYLACADAGHVFSFGVNKFGELGLGHDKETTKPVLIPELQSVYRVACGRHHSAAIDGKFW